MVYLLSLLLMSSSTGIRGYDMFIDAHGDVEGNYSVLAVKPHPPAYRTFQKTLQPIGYFKSDDHKIPVSESSTTISIQCRIWKIFDSN